MAAAPEGWTDHTQQRHRLPTGFGSRDAVLNAVQSCPSGLLWGWHWQCQKQCLLSAQAYCAVLVQAAIQRSVHPAQWLTRESCWDQRGPSTRSVIRASTLEAYGPGVWDPWHSS